MTGKAGKTASSKFLAFALFALVVAWHEKILWAKNSQLSSENESTAAETISWHWNDYRIGDGIARRPDAPGCGRFPGSIVCEYSKKTREPNDIGALIHVLDSKAWNFAVADPYTVLVHVRLGDGLCAQIDEPCRGEARGTPDCWTNDSDCWYDEGSNTKQYAYSKHWYFQVLQDLQHTEAKRMVVLGEKRHWTRTPDPRNGNFSIDDAYLANLADFFRPNFPQVELREPKFPDEDFFFLSSAKFFVQGGGGFSDLVAQIVKSRGGVVFKPRKYDADL